MTGGPAGVEWQHARWQHARGGDLYYELVNTSTMAAPRPTYLLRVTKVLRTQVVVAYMREAGYRGAVCFSCGNASEALRRQGVEVVDVSPTGELMATRWWTPAEVHRTWPDLLDATSGHLPVHLMVRIAQAIREVVGELVAYPRALYEVPTGSGETITCLRWAYPECVFKPVSDGTPATARDERAPLRRLAEELRA